MKKVYIAGPYSKGDTAINVKKAMDIANELINLGYAPFCPHLSHFLHINNQQPYEKWLELDIVFLECCDYLLRFPGESEGADKEVIRAKELGIPVFYNLFDLMEYSL